MANPQKEISGTPAARHQATDEKQELVSAATFCKSKEGTTAGTRVEKRVFVLVYF